MLCGGTRRKHDGAGVALIALDTNVLVRCLTLDDPRQVPAAQILLGHPNGVFVAKTVLLELEWVLRVAYTLAPTVIHEAMIKLLGLPNLSLENPSQVAQALEGYSRGLDFADALHLVSATADEGMFTFDAKFVRAAAAAGHSVHLAGASAGRRVK